MGQQANGAAVAHGPIDRDALDQIEAGQADERERSRDAVVGKGVVDVPHGVGVVAARMEHDHFQALGREGLGHVHDLQRVGFLTGNARICQEYQTHGTRSQIS